jgi:rhomboid family protein
MSYQDFRPSRFQQIPIVVKNILIINVILFIANKIPGSPLNLDRYLDLWDVHSDYFKPYQFITYMFMHDSNNFSHILFNMLAVYMFGSILENLWGPKRFLNFYILCGLAAAALQLGISYYNNNPTILLGASGAVFGLLVAFAMMFPDTQLNIYFMIPVKAKYFVGIYALIEFVLGFSGYEDNIGHFAHIGGAAMGLIIMLIWRRSKKVFF